MFRQTVCDFMVNQQFRKDYWVKGARRLTSIEQAETWRSQLVVLAMPRADIALKNGVLGEATLQKAVYNPILDVLADHRPRTIGQIEQQLKGAGISLTQVLQAVMLLANTDALRVAQDEATIAKTKPHSDRLNALLCNKARSSEDIHYLASPVVGGGVVVVPPMYQLFMLAKSQGKSQLAEWASFAWANLAAQGVRLVKDGKALESEEDNINVLLEQANEFGRKYLPMLQALGIAMAT
jgi:hypothetical protein